MTTMTGHLSRAVLGGMVPSVVGEATRGREMEWQLVRDLLRGAHRESGGVLLVDGEQRAPAFARAPAGRL
jgi:hypothetical protein